jgi:hypothetical protein
LPGSEGGGIADVLYNSYDFTGTLTHTWPASSGQVPINTGTAYSDEQKGSGGTPQWAYGFGMKYSTSTGRRAIAANYRSSPISPAVTNGMFRVSNIPSGTPWRAVVTDMSGRTIMSTNGVSTGTMVAVTTKGIRSGVYVTSVAAGGKNVRTLMTVSELR